MSKIVFEFPPEYADDPSLDKYRVADAPELHAVCEGEIDRLLNTNPKSLEINSYGMQKVSMVKSVVAPTGYESLEPAGHVMKVQFEGMTLLSIASPLLTRDGPKTGTYTWSPDNPNLNLLEVERMGAVSLIEPDLAIAAARLFTPRLIKAEGFNPRCQRIEQSDGRDEIVSKSWLRRLINR